MVDFWPNFVYFGTILAPKSTNMAPKMRTVAQEGLERPDFNNKSENINVVHPFWAKIGPPREAKGAQKSTKTSKTRVKMTMSPSSGSRLLFWSVLVSKIGKKTPKIG